MNTNDHYDEFIKGCIAIVIAGAREYMNAHNLKANPEALEACCKAWLKIQLPIALRDAKEALDCGMIQAAEATFSATLFNAGMEAAKEAALPSAQFDHVNAIGQS